MPEDTGADTRRAARLAREAARRKRQRKALALTAVAVCVAVAVGVGVWLISRPQEPAPSAPAVAAVSTETAEPTASIEPSVAPVAEEPTAPAPVIGKFDVELARKHVEVLAGDIGVREAGTDGEREAARYISAELEKLGYAPSTVKFSLPNGRTSQNVIAELPGTGTRRVILGGHYDTKKPSPGANDNGTGSAALLALAAELKDEPLAPTIVFVWFGDEEMIDSNQDHHHYGSRAYVKAMTDAEKAATVAMLSVDMIGYGPEFRVRTMGKGPQTLQKDLLAFGAANGYSATYMKDPSKYGYSDHEPFELAGMPAAWIEWRDDPVYHSTKDDAAHIEWDKVRQAGQLTLDYVRALDEQRMAALIGG